MFSISESGERAGAEGQEKAAVAHCFSRLGKTHTSVWGMGCTFFPLLLLGKNKLSKNWPFRDSPLPALLLQTACPFV